MIEVPTDEPMAGEFVATYPQPEEGASQHAYVEAASPQLQEAGAAMKSGPTLSKSAVVYASQDPDRDAATQQDVDAVIAANQSLTCKPCGKNYKFRALLNKHIREKHEKKQSQPTNIANRATEHAYLGSSVANVLVPEPFAQDACTQESCQKLGLGCGHTKKVLLLGEKNGSLSLDSSNNNLRTNPSKKIHLDQMEAQGSNSSEEILNESNDNSDMQNDLSPDQAMTEREKDCVPHNKPFLHFCTFRKIKQCPFNAPTMDILMDHCHTHYDCTIPKCGFKATDRQRKYEHDIACHKRAINHRKKDDKKDKTIGMPLSCKLCDNKFNEDRTLKHHMKSVHGEKIFCFYCNKKEFKEASAKNKHDALCQNLFDMLMKATKKKEQCKSFFCYASFDDGKGLECHITSSHKKPEDKRRCDVPKGKRCIPPKKPVIPEKQEEPVMIFKYLKIDNGISSSKASIETLQNILKDNNLELIKGSMKEEHKNDGKNGVWELEKMVRSFEEAQNEELSDIIVDDLIGRVKNLSKNEKLKVFMTVKGIPCTPYLFLLKLKKEQQAP